MALSITGPSVISRTGEHLFEVKGAQVRAKIENIKDGVKDDLTIWNDHLHWNDTAVWIETAGKEEYHLEVSSVGFSNLKIGDWREFITCSVGNNSDYQWANGVKESDGSVPDTQIDLYVPGGSDMEDFSEGDLLYGGPLDDRGCILEVKAYDNFSTMVHCKLIQGTVDKAKAMYGWPSGFKATNHKGAHNKLNFITAIVSPDEVQSNATYSVYVQGTDTSGNLSDAVLSGKFNIDAEEATPAYTFSFRHNQYDWHGLNSSTGKGIVSFEIESTYPDSEYTHKMIHTISAPDRNSDYSFIVVENKTYDLNFGGTTGGIIGQWGHLVEGLVVEKATGKIMDRRGFKLWEADASAAVEDNVNHNYWDDGEVWSDEMLWSDLAEAEVWQDIQDWIDSNNWKE